MVTIRSSDARGEYNAQVVVVVTKRFHATPYFLAGKWGVDSMKVPFINLQES